MPLGVRDDLFLQEGRGLTEAIAELAEATRVEFVGELRQTLAEIAGRIAHGTHGLKIYGLVSQRVGNRFGLPLQARGELLQFHSPQGLNLVAQEADLGSGMVR